MNDPRERRDHQDPKLPAAERECQETLFEDGLDSREKARRLFAHGLLRAQEELLRPDASVQRESRVGGILERLDEPAPALEDLADESSPEPRPIEGSTAPLSRVELRRTRFRLLVSAIAALLLASITLYWLSSRGQNSLPELLAMTRQNHDRGLHIYRGYVQTRRHRQPFDLALAEGGKAQIHVARGNGSIDIGYTGKIGWFKTPTGKAVEVPVWDLAPLLQALPENLKTLSPNLSYLEVEGLLSKILTKEGMRITGRAKPEDGKLGELVVLEGRYSVQGRGPRMHGRGRMRLQRGGRRWSRRTYTGTVKVRIESERGRIHDIRLEEDRWGSVTVLERVQSLTGDVRDKKPAWVDFEPEFTKSVPSLRMWRFMGYFLRKIREANEARRER